MSFKLISRIGLGFKTEKMGMNKKRRDDGPEGVGRAVKPVRPSPCLSGVARAIPKVEKPAKEDLQAANAGL